MSLVIVLCFMITVFSQQNDPCAQSTTCQQVCTVTGTNTTACSCYDGYIKLSTNSCQREESFWISLFITSVPNKLCCHKSENKIFTHFVIKNITTYHITYHIS